MSSEFLLIYKYIDNMINGAHMENWCDMTLDNANGTSIIIWTDAL